MFSTERSSLRDGMDSEQTCERKSVCVESFFGDIDSDVSFVLVVLHDFLHELIFGLGVLFFSCFLILAYTR